MLANLVASSAPETSIVVHFTPTLRYQVVGITASPVNPAKSIDESEVTDSLAILDRFMSRWSKLVGDPVMSKWIVVALGISVFLNGYLLKGIASGSDSSFAPGSAAEAAARILLASTGSTVDRDDVDAKAGLKRRWSGGQGISELQKEWTAEDAAAMAQQHRRRSEKADIEAHKVAPELIKLSTKVSERRQSSEEDSEISPPPSPISVRIKLRKPTITNGALLHTAESSESSLPPSPSVPGVEREIRLSPSTVALVPLGKVPDTPRSLEVCAKIFDGGVGALLLNDEEIVLLVQKGKVAAYALEKLLNNYERSVSIRRALICEIPFHCFFPHLADPTMQREHPMDTLSSRRIYRISTSTTLA